MWLVVPGLILLVVYLAHASETPSAPAGQPNGVDINATQGALVNPGPDNALPYLGATGRPSPYTGLGLPAVSMQYRQILYMQNPPARSGTGSAFLHSMGVKTTGLLDPLPDRGTRSKQLVTADLQVRPGRKL